MSKEFEVDLSISPVDKPIEDVGFLIVSRSQAGKSLQVSFDSAIFN